MRLLELDEIKQTEIGILDYVVDKCNIHGLRYFLAYGTLLGAVRHKGFIPWDDDVDIWMPRPDYERLIAIVKDAGDGRFRIKSLHDADHYYEWAKVCDTTTRVEETGLQEAGAGVWLDIFPMDGMESEGCIARWRFAIRTRPRVAAVYGEMPPVPNRLMKPCVFLFWRLCRRIGFRFFLDATDRLSQKYPYDGSPYVGYLADYGSRTNHYPKEFFGEACMVEFEGRTYRAPRNYDAVLTSLYGNYMQLPPEDRRLPHRMTAYRLDRQEESPAFESVPQGAESGATSGGERRRSHSEDFHKIPVVTK